MWYQGDQVADLHHSQGPDASVARTLPSPDGPRGRPSIVKPLGALLAVAPAAPGEGLIGDWSPGIGDPSALGWVTTVAYLVTATLAWGVVRRTPRLLSEARRERSLWKLLAAGFLLLGINKQLDLQSALTEIGRMMAQDEGWYDERRRVQLAFVVVVAALAVALAVALFVLGRRAGRDLQIALVGSALVCCFVVIRAASFHHMDLLLGSSWIGIRLNNILELGGIGIVLWASHRRYRLLRPVAVAESRTRR